MDWWRQKREAIINLLERQAPVARLHSFAAFSATPLAIQSKALELEAVAVRVRTDSMVVAAPALAKVEIVDPLAVVIERTLPLIVVPALTKVTLAVAYAEVLTAHIDTGDAVRPLGDSNGATVAKLRGSDSDGTPLADEADELQSQIRALCSTSATADVVAGLADPRSSNTLGDDTPRTLNVWAFDATVYAFQRSRLTITSTISHFGFQGRRNRTAQSAQPKPMRTEHGIVLSPRPPLPPRSDKTDLSWRLWLLLAPPIEEILGEADLALPLDPYGYQKYGIVWLLQRKEALLADEMGLGKTMQAIIAARLLWRDGEIEQVLVICPKSLIGNWRREIAQWWPDGARRSAVSGASRRFFLGRQLGGVAIRIINYEGLAREFEWVRGARLKYDLVILDEAQRIKNPDSLSARSVKAIRARYRWALTGTPLENRIEDLRSICEFVHPGLVQSDALAVIRREIGPYMLRRRAEDVLKDLPRMVDQDIAIRLTRRQRVAYDRAERDGVLRLNDLGENVTITHVFQLITSLRQVCNFEPVSGESAKLDYLREELDEIVDGGRKALVFSQFTNRSGLSALAMELEEFRPAQLHGRVPPRKRDQLVETFGRTTEHAVMLCNYKVAGVGLNLQAANYVYLFDRWWNPAVEDQAIKRVHRIGQRDCVFVRRFVCRNTIEERILKKLQEKRALFDSVINEAEPARAMGLTEEEVFSLFDLHVRPRRRK